jgi:hypothetical protein
MALRKSEISDRDRDDQSNPNQVTVISPGDRLRAMFAMLREGAPAEDEDDGLDELEALLNEGRSEENRIVLRPRRSFLTRGCWV